MFVDLSVPGGGGSGPFCKGCHQAFQPLDTPQIIRLEKYDQPALKDMSGLYHAACAAPLLSVIRAMDALHRISGRS